MCIRDSATGEAARPPAPPMALSLLWLGQRPQAQGVQALPWWQACCAKCWTVVNAAADTWVDTKCACADAAATSVPSTS
eukprot:10188114-Karenia_brevis.AAC.1